MIIFILIGVAVRTTMDATITNQYCAVLTRLNDQVEYLYEIIFRLEINKLICFERMAIFIVFIFLIFSVELQ